MKILFRIQFHSLSSWEKTLENNNFTQFVNSLHWRGKNGTFEKKSAGIEYIPVKLSNRDLSF